MKKWIYIMLSGILLLGNMLPVSAAGKSNVVYEGGAEKFVFPQGKNLFLDFSDAMPGDTLTQTVGISNTTQASVTIRLRAETDEPYREFLNQLTLKLEYTDPDGKLSTLYEGSAAAWKMDGSEIQNISLGTFSSKEEGTLKVTLQIPSSLGNEYQEALGKVKWIFQTEAAKEEPGKKHHESHTTETALSPKTGDTSLLLPAVCALAGSGLILTGIVLRRRKYK